MPFSMLQIVCHTCLINFPPDYPSYHFKFVNENELVDLRLKKKYILCPTIKGSSSFQVIIFEPRINDIRVAPHLCSCHQCINIKYGSCFLFNTHDLVYGVLNQPSLRWNYISADPEESEAPIDKSFICENTVCAIVAADSSADTVWFIYITKSDCIEEDSVTDMLMDMLFLSPNHSSNAIILKTTRIWRKV